MAEVNGNELLAQAAFTAQSGVFDGLYGADTIIAYKRKRVRAHVLQYVEPGAAILELNSGTGQDAIFFAQNGFTVHATDVAPGMQQQLVNKVRQAGLQNQVSNELCSFTQLESLEHKGPYGLIFSNFAGLNCTGQLDKVLASFPALVKPGGQVTLVVLPKFCLWEVLLLFKGKFKTAFRRFNAANGRAAHVEGVHFKCWYYSPQYIINHLESDFDLVSLEGLCTLVPPSYMEGFAEKHPRLYKALVNLEGKLKTSWPWKYWGDYFIISLRRKEA